ncbi:hypothetical protein BD414DRAFT_480329 [Trametes punicea]|nr:hypothetical protein BD414DRAFT_480329 [Trametes punicea]
MLETVLAALIACHRELVLYSCSTPSPTGGSLLNHPMVAAHDHPAESWSNRTSCAIAVTLVLPTVNRNALSARSSLKRRSCLRVAPSPRDPDQSARAGSVLKSDWQRFRGLDPYLALPCLSGKAPFFADLVEDRVLAIRTTLMVLPELRTASYMMVCRVSCDNAMPTGGHRHCRRKHINRGNSIANSYGSQASHQEIMEIDCNDIKWRRVQTIFVRERS